MALVAYTSAAPFPLVSQADATIDLSMVVLPVTANLYGDGLDSLDPTPALTYAWTILERAAGSAVTFVDTGTIYSALQNPVLQDINEWENVRVMLVVTNTNNGAVSEAQRFLAPDSAFVHARVNSLSLGLQKLAYGERNYKVRYHEVVAAIEALAVSGVVIPPELLQLISGGYATYMATLLHKHNGPDVDVATFGGDQGTVGISDAPLDPLNPVALNSDYQPQSVQVAGTPTGSGWTPGIEVATTTLGADKYPHALFPVRSTCTLKGLSFLFADFGDAANVYEFEVYYGPAADWASGAALTKIAAFDTSVGPAGIANATWTAHTSTSPTTLTAGAVVGVFVKTAPSALLARVGHSLTVVAHFYREV